MLSRRSFLLSGVAVAVLPAMDVPSPESVSAAAFAVKVGKDLPALHGLDAEAELARILAEEISREMDRVVLEGGKGVSTEWLHFIPQRESGQGGPSDGFLWRDWVRPYQGMAALPSEGGGEWELAKVRLSKNPPRWTDILS